MGRGPSLARESSHSVIPKFQEPFLSPGIETLPTPVKVDNLELMLSTYDPILRNGLVSGFRNGFDIGFRGQVNSDSKVNNLRSTNGLYSVVTEALEKEVQAGRIAGPFSAPPFGSFQLNPIGMVPKKEKNKYRMIFDLSYPPGSAINDSIDDSFARVQYASMSDAISALLACGKGAYMAKTDIVKAFRLIPIAPSQYHLLCVKWDGVYYYDKTLTMGCRSSCRIFQSLSDALRFIAMSRGIEFLINYLDDFLIVASTKLGCLQALREFRAMCVFLGIPLALEKTFLPDQIMIFLGLEYDSIEEVVRLPVDKLVRCKEGLAWLLGEAVRPAWISQSHNNESGKVCDRQGTAGPARSVVRLSELQSVLGLLSFACTVVVPGRAFLRRLFALTIGIKKPFYFVKITEAAKADLRVWQTFLHNYNGVTWYRNELFLSEQVCHFYTDACKSLGCGAWFGKFWFSIPWPSQWWIDQTITFLELVPIVLALEAWGDMMRNQCAIIHSDNLALVHVINSQSSKETLVMSFIRRLVLKALSFNVLIKAVHVSGIHNTRADLLSRLQVPRFLELHLSANKVATSISLPHSTN